LISGHTQAHHALEEELAEFTGRERALLFSTGYMANLGIVSALIDRRGRVLEDRLNHASLLDGGLLSRAEFQRYQHNDIEDLQQRLHQSAQKTLIVTDGVFSMDGDLAHLPRLAQLAKQQQAALMVDDAHGFGVLGATGAGVAEHFALDQQQVPIFMATLGKACGSFGAFVAGNQDLIEFLIQKSRSYIYTTAMPAAVAEATRASLKLLKTEAWRRERLHQLIRYFRKSAEQQGLKLMDSMTAIQPILVGDSHAVLLAGQRLQDQGFWVGAIRPPTVPKGTARLRITLSAEHSFEQIDRLLEVLPKALLCL
jgi:8-amino-7-oxononanoate synthase